MGSLQSVIAAFLPNLTTMNNPLKSKCFAIKNKIPVLFLVLFFCATTSAQEYTYEVFSNNTDSLQYNYFITRVQEQFDKRREIVKKASRSKKSLLERRDAIRAHYRKMIGELPAKCPLNPKVNWEKDMELIL